MRKKPPGLPEGSASKYQPRAGARATEARGQRQQSLQRIRELAPASDEAVEATADARRARVGRGDELRRSLSGGGRRGVKTDLAACRLDAELLARRCLGEGEIAHHVAAGDELPRRVERLTGGLALEQES